ncbi:chemotaxis protein MotA [Desulfitispora alkaliphila]|uniref:motility protein A n=1 Tax=Desulfitispora alkaliphila TaxID=622674 RepID=UPI003D190DC5
MDFATIAGIISGIALIFLAIVQGGAVDGFINVQGVLIVIGGTFASTLVSSPLKDIIQHMKTVKVAFKNTKNEPEEIIAILVGFAEKARREGLLALEAEAEQVDDEFLKKGVQLVVDGTDPELVRSILDIELTFLEERHKEGQGLFEHLGAMAPAFGMIGTLIGLINMLQVLDNPDAIGPGMAVALTTTFYGSLMANLIFIPIAKKLKTRSSAEILTKEVMIEGILSIQAGENPRIVEEKMKAFLAPKSRDQVESIRRGGVNIGG